MQWDDLTPEEQRDASHLAQLDPDVLVKAIATHFNAIEAIHLSRSIYLAAKVRSVFESLPAFQAWTRSHPEMQDYQSHLESYLLTKDLVRGGTIVFRSPVSKDTILMDQTGHIHYTDDSESGLLARATLDEVGISYQLKSNVISFEYRFIPLALYGFMNIGFEVFKTDRGDGIPFDFAIACRVCDLVPGIQSCSCCLVPLCGRRCQLALHASNK